MPKTIKLPSLIFIVLSFFAFLLPAAAEGKTFSDLYGFDSSTVKNIEYLAERDIVHGNPDGTFLPLNEINRAELTKLMVAMQGVDPDPEIYRNCFTDVKEEWFARYVCYAKEKEWIHGHADGSFKPADSVSGSETLKIVLNSLFADEIAAQTQEEIKSGIVGLYSVSEYDWFAPYVAFAQNKGIIFEGSGFGSGKGDGFVAHRPKRWRVIPIIYRALMVYENDLEMFQHYVADPILKEEGFGHLVFSQSGCYKLGDMEFDFYSDYLKSKYGIEKPYQSIELLYYLSIMEDSDHLDYERLKDEDLVAVFPLLDSGYFCDLEEDGFVFSNITALTEENLDSHLMYFDQDGELIEDKIADCSGWAQFISALDFRDLDGFDLKNLEWLDCVYLKDNESVYLFEMDKIEGADAATFELLRLPYSKDAKQAYYIGELVEGADGGSFETFEEEQGDEDYLNLIHYAKDAEHVFYEEKMIEGADAKTFEILQDGFSRDAVHVFEQGNLLKQYDAPSFQMIDENYTKDKNGVYYSSSYRMDWDYDSSTVTQLIGANSETIEILEWGYAVDGEKVYYQGVLMPSADGATFKLLEESSNTLYYLNTVAFDKNAVYENGKIADWFDPDTMELINPFFIKKEGEIHFAFGNSFDGSFKAITSELGPLVEEDFSNFEALEDAPIFPGMWGRSDNKVYLMPVHLIEVTDAPTFEFINKVYSKDSKNVFHLDAHDSGLSWYFFDIKGADPLTFEPLAVDDSEYDHFGKDANNVYYKLETLDTKDLEMASAELLEEEGVIKDANGYVCVIDEMLEDNAVLSCG